MNSSFKEIKVYGCFIKITLVHSTYCMKVYLGSIFVNDLYIQISLLCVYNSDLIDSSSSKLIVIF